MKEITWAEMINLKNQMVAPFTINFSLNDPIDEAGDIAFTSTRVVGFKGNFPVVAFKDDIGEVETFIAVDCETVYCEIV